MSERARGERFTLKLVVLVRGQSEAQCLKVLCRVDAHLPGHRAHALTGHRPALNRPKRRGGAPQGARDMFHRKPPPKTRNP